MKGGTMQITITDMDFTRSAIASAMAEGMTVDDLWMCAEHAESAQDFDEAVNLLAQTVPEPRAGLLQRIREAWRHVVEPLDR